MVGISENRLCGSRRITMVIVGKVVLVTLVMFVATWMGGWRDV